jgi:uncharacterized membrane protein YdjX (TVP38/TMEM64 family)
MVPMALLVALCGFVLGPWVGFETAFAGALVGAVLGYAIGARLRRDTVRRLVGRRVEQLSGHLRTGGVRALFAIRLLALAPYAAINVVAGATRFPLRGFLLASVLALAPGTLALAAIGHGAAHAIGGYGSRPLAAALALTLALAAALFAIRHHLRRITRGDGASP